MSWGTESEEGGSGGAGSGGGRDGVRGGGGGGWSDVKGCQPHYHSASLPLGLATTHIVGIWFVAVQSHCCGAVEEEI
jgi:hypothetical protein